jgi:sugar phosphate isomerase/epimerase
MKLALSGRLFESRSGYTMDLDAFLSFARESGWDGVEIRYPQLPLETPPERQDAVGALLRDLGLVWVFGAVEGIVDDAAFARAARMLDLHDRVGCRFTRFTVFKPEQVPWAQRFADEAARRGRRLIMQVHCGTLPNNVPNALDTLRRIGRPNVGLSFDACHLRFDGDERPAEGVRALAGHLWGVSLQNYKPAPPDAPKETVIRINDRPYARAMPGDPLGVDLAAVFAALRGVAFDGFATVMCDTPPGQDARALVGAYLAFCRRCLA